MFAELIATPDTSSTLLVVSLLAAVCLLVWDTVEVGRNDAANIVNAIFGARILNRRRAVLLAGVGVVLGAVASSRAIAPARGDLFDPTLLKLNSAIALYLAVYLVHTAVLYGYSAYGVPISTTSTVMAAFLGASFVAGGMGEVHWDKAGSVLNGIVLSMLISGGFGFGIQRIVRSAMRDRCQHLATTLFHGGWIAGGMLAGLTYFMLVRGMVGIPAARRLADELTATYGQLAFVLALWIGFGVAVHLSLILLREKAAYWLFPVVAMIGTVCMGFAFGQNDLANCLAPGLSTIEMVRNADRPLAAVLPAHVSRAFLLVAGVLLVLGMRTRHAQRVTRTIINSGSMSNNVGLWAPRWCIVLARMLLRFRRRRPALAPPAGRSAAGKALHYDPLRACVILTVSASVIATATSLSLPVSTTYVAFMAVIATGTADRVLQRGDADLKVARTVWVVCCWLISVVLSAGAAAGVFIALNRLGTAGTLACAAVNILVCRRLKHDGDRQELLVREHARERRHPEEFAEYEA